MQSRNKGFVAHVLTKKNRKKLFTVWSTEKFWFQNLNSSILAAVLNQAVKVVNYIKTSSLRSRIVAALCEAVDSEKKTLLYYIEARWLSEGNVLSRLVFLKVEIISFIDTEKGVFSFLKDDVWWLRVSFLSDLFDKLNEMNLSLQGAEQNPSQSRENQ